MTHSIAFYCADVDDVPARARDGGATLREPVQTFVTGDQFGSITDPYGQRWSIMTRVEDVDAIRTSTPGATNPGTGQRPYSMQLTQPSTSVPSNAICRSRM